MAIYAKDDDNMFQHLSNGRKEQYPFLQDGNFFLTMHELHQYIVRSFFSEENQLNVCRHRSDLEITPCLIKFIGIRFGFPHIAQLEQRYQGNDISIVPKA